MKLYTEEQVRDLLRQVWTYTPTQIDNLIDIMEPIEIPSDEEIEQESLKSDFEYTFRNGAKWMRDKIQGGEQ